MNLNKALIVGRVTADPQLRTTASGQSVTTFSVATNRVWNGKNGKQEETEFHNVVAWGRTAEIASQFLTKGAMVYVEGRLQTRSWQDKQNVSHKATEIICERLQLGPRAAGSAPRSAAAAGAKAKPADGAEEFGNEPSAPEEIPVIDIEDDIKAEDLPF
jgi:single-strand DNA-binding protein